MNVLSRVLMFLAAISPGLLFLFPMWKIYLEAPQYPEGLEMHIWINEISGSSEGTLQNFNILNHYIGMEPIHAESFTELKVMPYIVLFFMIAGFAVALIGKRKLILFWGALLILGGAVGILDFYLWLVRFGTNLSPEAPIKVQGMTYIPPLIGSKELLNFDALSLPATGSFGILLALIFAGLAYFVSRKKKSNETLTL